MESKLLLDIRFVVRQKDSYGTFLEVTKQLEISNRTLVQIASLFEKLEELVEQHRNVQ